MTRKYERLPLMSSQPTRNCPTRPCLGVASFNWLAFSVEKLVDSEKQGVTTPRDTTTRTIRFFVMLTASAEAGTACVTYAVRLGPINRFEPDEGADEHHQGAVTLRGQRLSLWLNTLLC